MDAKTKLTPLQIDVVAFLKTKEGEVVPLKQLQRQFPSTDPNQDCDERLADSVWGLIEAGIVFEPLKRPTTYHLTEEACRQAATIIAGRAAAEAADKREIARMEAVGRRVGPARQGDGDKDDDDVYSTINRGMTEVEKKPAKRDRADKAPPPPKV